MGGSWFSIMGWVSSSQPSTKAAEHVAERARGKKGGHPCGRDPLRLAKDGHEDGAKPPGYRLMLREMAADERPREKLKLRGSAVLSDGELLAIILNTGVRRMMKW